MPCYHFTFHGYGTWMPDEDDGYVRRDKGRLPQDTVAAVEYRRRMTDDEVEFSDAQQQALIDEVHVAAMHQLLRVHFIATEPTHIHVLISWTDDLRLFEKVRSSLRQSLARRLSKECGQRQWLSEGGSRRRVTNQTHYDYLVTSYLPEHSGWKWSEEKALHK
jgi:hypothetical protein